MRLEMIKHYTMKMSVAVQACIIPALEVLVLEHRLREMDLIRIARHSPIVPEGREALYGKALYFGFERDFATAVHLLVPQVEHLARFHLQAAGAITTVLSPSGIEQEKGHSALMDDAAADQVFGPDLSFELRTIFCGPTGPNLRNDIAHGLIGDAGAQSITTCYAWWFGYRLAFAGFWNSIHAQRSGEPPYDTI